MSAWACAAIPPRLGQHSRELLRGLGYEDAAIEALVADGVLGVGGEGLDPGVDAVTG